MSSIEPIWTPTPEAIEASQLTAFSRFAEARTGTRLSSYTDFFRWSLERADRFWPLLLEWSGFAVEGDLEPAFEGESVEEAVFFPRLRLSYVENLLRSREPGDEDRVAIVGRDETGRSVRWTRKELTRDVLALASSLRELGLSPGHRVVAIASNTPETAIACLASVALGASWSAVAPDLGTQATLERFRQLEPEVLFCHASYRSHGAARDISDRIAAVVDAVPSISLVVALDGAAPDVSAFLRAPRTSALSALVESGRSASMRALSLDALPRFPFDHPLFVLFSSGTTGVPKCIVHGAGGTLLEHVKEHRLHTDLGPRDVLYFQTSCGWMMYNWQLSALASGATIVLYDGSVSYPEMDSLWRIVSEERVTVLGTSPAYLQFCRDAGIVPKEIVDLSALRAIQSTGSVLADSHFDWVADAVGPVPLQSISGGTDIIGCFVLGNPNLPVYRGEMQCVSAGLDVRALRPDGTTVGPLDATENVVGELVCARPFPSRPVGLFGDPEGHRFHEAYFAQNPGFWTHGDVLEVTPRGTTRIHGRSDGILNIRGIRIGPAEIYSALADFGPIAECMALEQIAPNEPGGTRLVLLVVMKDGATLDRALKLKIKKELKERCSMAHVPAEIAQVPELPVTFNGKRSERAARDALNGRPVANLGALKNPGCLEAIASHPDLKI